MRKCTIRVAKTKALISFAVFAYADCWFSHEAVHLIMNTPLLKGYGLNMIFRSFLKWIH